MKNNTLATSSFYTLRLSLLFAGPLLSWVIAQRFIAGSLAAGEINIIALTLAILWSPLYFSIPALLMQRERDLLLPSTGGIISSLFRGIKLVPAMLNLESGIRTETVASLVGWGSLLIATLPNLNSALTFLT